MTRDESRQDLIPIDEVHGRRRWRGEEPENVFRIRPATADDAPAVRALIRRVRINPTGLDWRRVLVAEGQDGTVLACGQVKPHGDGTRELSSVAVDERWRGRGAARAIIERLQRHAVPPRGLPCRSGLEPMYTRFGFQRVHDRR